MRTRTSNASFVLALVIVTVSFVVAPLGAVTGGVMAINTISDDTSMPVWLLVPGDFAEHTKPSTVSIGSRFVSPTVEVGLFFEPSFMVVPNTPVDLEQMGYNPGVCALCESICAFTPWQCSCEGPCTP